MVRVKNLARPGGFEPPTHSLEGLRFINDFNLVVACRAQIVARKSSPTQGKCNTYDVCRPIGSATQRTLYDVKVPDNAGHVNSRGHESAVGDAIPRLVIRHHHPPRAAFPAIAIEENRHVPVEGQAGKPPVVLIVEVETASHFPTRIRLAAGDGKAARLVDFRFKLIPTEDKPGLIVEHPLFLDTLSLSFVAVRLRGPMGALKFPGDFLIDRDDLGQRPHDVSRASSRSRVNGVNSPRAVTAVICHFGSAKILAASEIR